MYTFPGLTRRCGHGGTREHSRPAALWNTGGEPKFCSVTNDTTFYVGAFPAFLLVDWVVKILQPSYWLLPNKQPIEIGGKISPPNQPIERLKNAYVKSRIVCK